MKLAVVGGGSTYTPELVDGLGRLRDVLPVDELVLVDPSVRAARAGRRRRAADPRAAGAPGPAGHVDDARAGARRRGRGAAPAAGRRAGRAQPGRDLAAGVRLRRAGDDRRGRAGEGAADGPGRARHRRAGHQGGAGRVDHRLHQPGRHRHPSTPAGGAPRGRPVQRGDRVPASLRRLARRTPGVAGARPRRAQPPDVGAGRAGGRRGPAAGAAGVARRGDRRVGRAAARAAALAGRGAVLLPALLLRPRRGGPRAARGAVTGRGGGRDRAHSCWSCTPTRRSTRSPSCWRSGAGRSTPRPRCSWPRRCSATARRRRTW